MDKVLALGTKLCKVAGGQEKPISNVNNISGPSMSSEPIEITDHDSEDGFKRFVGGLKDGGEVSIEGRFTNSESQIALMTDYYVTEAGKAHPEFDLMEVVYKCCH